MSLLYSWYGDDFTGSTDVLEALTTQGVPSTLFLQPPDAAALTRFSGCRAVGVAGVSRSKPPEWMDANLPPIFRSLRALDAPLCHYKVCSTFDSSPTHGSIGRAIEIGRAVFGEERPVPVVVGVPALRRYLIFGNLFAAAGDGANYRIDRHPTMSRHPVTPMHEADLRVHLARQTNLPIGLIDIVALRAGATLGGDPVVLIDTMDDDSLLRAGRLIGEAHCRFAAGSSGVAYAMLAWWRSQEMLPAEPPRFSAGPADGPVLVISGSCSPVTERQIRWALGNGFKGIAVDPAATEVERICEAAAASLRTGRNTLIYSALGPDSVVDGAAHLGESLGRIARHVVQRSGVRRMIVAGGDTSGHVGTALRIDALTLLRPLAPGAPLCRVWSADPAVDGMSIVMKGGQVGAEVFFAL